MKVMKCLALCHDFFRQIIMNKREGGREDAPRARDRLFRAAKPSAGVAADALQRRGIR